MTTGYAIRSRRLVNRSGAKPIPQAVWESASSDGVVLDTLGPGNLAKELEPLWPQDKRHVPLDDVRDWFASYVYMPRLRDDATLSTAFERLFADLAAPYAYATGFNEETGLYEGVGSSAQLIGDLASGLLVCRDAIKPAEPEPGAGEDTGGATTDTEPPERPGDQPEPPSPKHLPKRFFATIAIDPERAGLEVARIMDGLLVELTRTGGSSLSLTLELDGRAAEQGYPEDVVDTVKANARDLNLDDESFGFEE